MEGAGEGVVAILQGMTYSGLKVTVVPESRLRLKRKSVLMDLGIDPLTRVTQSSVETNTERVFKHASAPMCDVRYASTYQFGNCIPESHKSSLGLSKYPRHDIITKHSGEFAESLRKYPIVTSSSEVLQRIISYTNTDRNIRKLRSTRSLSRKSTSHVKNEIGMNTGDVYVKKPNRSITKIGSKYSSQKEQLDYKYDYLKSISFVPRSADIRCLTKIRKFLKNRLLEIIDDRPSMCPKIQYRYNRHKKNCCRMDTKQIPMKNNDWRDLTRDMKTSNGTSHTAGLSRHKSCFCNQPRKCLCKTKSNKMEPLESLMRKLYPDLVINQKEEIQSSGEKLKNQDDVDNITRVILDWLKTIPVYPNFTSSDKIRQEELAYKLSKILSKLKNQKDFASKAKSVIIKNIDDSPIWRPTGSLEKDQFFEKIALDLIKKLQDSFEDQVQQNISKIFSTLSFEEGVDVKQTQDDFLNKLKLIILGISNDDRKFIENIKSKVFDLFKKLPIQTKVDNSNEAIKKIVEQLLQLNFAKAEEDKAFNNDDEKFRETILNFCANVPEFDNIDFTQECHLIDDLVNIFKKYKNRRMNRKDVKSELMNELQNWLNDISNTRNIRLNSKRKNTLGIQMMKNVLGIDYNEDKRNLSDSTDSQEILEPLTKWFDTILELAGSNRRENRNDLIRLAEGLKEIQSRVFSLESNKADMKNEIFEFLQTKFLQRELPVDSKNFDDLVDKIISDLKEAKKKKQLTDEYSPFHKDISSWVKNVCYSLEDSNLEKNKVIMKLLDRLKNIRRLFDSASQINDAVSEFTQSLSDNAGIDINEKDKKMLQDKLLARWKQTPKKRKRWDKLKEFYSIMQSEINNVLREYLHNLENIDLNNIRKKVLGSITKNIEEFSVLDLNLLESEINNILTQVKELEKNKREDLTNHIIARLQRVLPQEIIKKSTVLSPDLRDTGSKRNLESGRKQKKQVNPKSPRIDNDQENNRRKVKDGRNTDLQEGDVRKRGKQSKTLSTIYQSSNSDLDVPNLMEYSDKTKNEILSINENKQIPTSTPISKNIVDLSIENVTDSTEKLEQEGEILESSKYRMKINNLIKNWLRNNDLLSKSDLHSDEIIDTVASDIVERQKYLQLSGKKSSDADELEHLKYQIFRKLKDIKNFEKMKQMMSEINGLYGLLGKINPPDLLKTEKSNHLSTKTDDNIIIDKITQWLDSLSPNLLKSSNMGNKWDLGKELVSNLKKLEKKPNNDNQIQKEISSWLSNISKDHDLNLIESEIENIRTQVKELVKNVPDDLTNNNARLQRVLPQEIRQNSTVLSQEFERDTEPNLESGEKQKKQLSPRSSRFENNQENKKSNVTDGRNTDLQDGDGRKSRKQSIPLSTVYQTSNSDLNVPNSVEYSDKTKNELLAVNKNKPIPTSTPISRNVADLSIENVTENTEQIDQEEEFSESTKYLKKINNIIKNWLRNNELLSKSDLHSDEIIGSIASDIVERQKYLQLSGTKYSEADELEHLKYQIFRKLKDIKNFAKLKQMMSEINGLYGLIKKVNPPDLSKSEKSNLPIAKTDDNLNIDKITQWLESLSPNLLKSPNINNKWDLVRELVSNLKKLEKKPNGVNLTQKEISSPLSKILRVHDLMLLESEIKNILTQVNELVKNDPKELNNHNIARLQTVLPQEILKKPTALSQKIGRDTGTNCNLESGEKQKKQQQKQLSPRSFTFENDQENNKSKVKDGRNTDLQDSDVRKRPKRSNTLSTIYQSSNSDLDVPNSMEYSDKTKSELLSFNKNKQIPTSTPISKNVVDLSIENVTGSTGKKKQEGEFLESTIYLMEINNIIKNWLRNNEFLSKSDLHSDEIIDSITSDIVERQKYLQLSGKKYSDADELEHLKYQIFRKLKNIKNFENMKQMMPEINSLYGLITKVTPPHLSKTEKSDLSPKTDDNIIIDKITQWLDSLSPNLLKSPNMNNKWDLVKELVSNLNKLEEKTNYDYQIQKEILSWLPNILRVHDDKICYQLAESLSNSLLSSTKILEQDGSGNDDLSSALIDWLINTPFYETASSEERYLQRNLALFLAMKLNNILQGTKTVDDSNDLLIEEIQNFLKTIPINNKFKTNDFYAKVAGELMNYLKQIFDYKNKLLKSGKLNITDSLSESENMIREMVKAWCSSLPIHLGYEIESREKAEKLKQDIAKQILEKSNILNRSNTSLNIPTDVSLLNEIDKIINVVPMNRELEKSLPVLKSILLDKLVNLKEANKERNSRKVLQDALATTLQEVENISDLKSPSFVSLQEKLADAFLNMHYHKNHLQNDDDVRAKLKDELYNEIKNFCNQHLRQRSEPPLDSKELRYNLYDTLMKVLNDIKNNGMDRTSDTLVSSLLNPEDRAHLDRIRQRATGYRDSVSRFKDIGTETDFQERTNDYTQTSITSLTENGSSNREVLPQVVIKEFYWDSSGSKQSLEMFVPPPLSPDKSILQETRNAQNQTEITIFDKTTKVDASQQFPDKNIVDKPLLKSQDDEYCLPSIREMFCRHQGAGNSFHRTKCANCRRCFDNNERYWFEQPCPYESCIARDDGQRWEDSVPVPEERMGVRREIRTFPENRKDDNYCDRNTCWNIRSNTCRPRSRHKLKYCSKCSASFCPHPSYSFFGRDF